MHVKYICQRRSRILDYFLQNNNISNMNSEEFRKNYRLILEKIFNNWQNLRLAVEHGMGGRNGQKVAIEIMNYTYEYCIGNDNITQGELQDVIEDLMDQEFDTICEDGSVSEICRHLLRYKQMCLQGQYVEIESELSKLPQGKEWLRPDVKVTYTPIAGDSSSEDGSDSDDNKDDDMMDVEGEIDADQPSGSRVTRSQSHKQKDNFVEPEDGWTTVRTRRK